MKDHKLVFLGLSVLLVIGLAISTGCDKKEAEERAQTPEAKEQEVAQPETDLPAAVVAAIEANVPDAEIDFVEVTEEDGITLYDIEFKSDRGEIELTADGIVIDVVTIITMADLPEGAAKAIQEAAEGAVIERLEKSEIRSEIKKEGEKAIIVGLDSPRYVYEAELEKDGRTGEIEVDADGNITEPLKWDEKE